MELFSFLWICSTFRHCFIFSPSHCPVLNQMTEQSHTSSCSTATRCSCCFNLVCGHSKAFSGVSTALEAHGQSCTRMSQGKADTGRGLLAVPMHCLNRYQEESLREKRHRLLQLLNHCPKTPLPAHQWLKHLCLPSNRIRAAFWRQLVLQGKSHYRTHRNQNAFGEQ